MHIVIHNTSGKRLPLTRGQIESLVRHARKSIPLSKNLQLGISAATTQEAKRLNTAYRGKQKATTILTFINDAVRGKGIDVDIILCPTAIQYLAKASNVPYRSAFARILVHGILHVGGRHHKTAIQEKQDERMINSIVQAFNKTLRLHRR